MGKIVAVTGNEACAYALKQINPDVCAAYPITPATDLMQRFSGYVSTARWIQSWCSLRVSTAQ